AVKVVDTSGKLIPDPHISRDGSRFQVSAAGFLPWSGVLEREEKTHPIVLLRPASLRGRVLSGGSVLKNFSVHLEAQEEPPQVTQDKPPPADGTYRLELLPPGLHAIVVQAEGFVPIERGVGLREGEERWLDLELTRAAWLAAAVLDANGKPLKGVVASIRTEGEDRRYFGEDEKKRLSKLRGTSNEKGSLVLGPLAWGIRHRIVFRHPERPARSLTLAPAAPLVTREVRLPDGGEIRLRLRDSKKKLIAGATAHLNSDDTADLDLVSEASPSNAEGILAAGPLPAGRYSIRLQAKGFLPITLRDRIVREGQRTDLGEVRLEPGLEVSGTVRDDAGSPLAGASVQAKFFEEGRRLSAQDETDREGRFRISGLPSGSVELRTDAKSFFPITKEKVPAGTLDLELKMTRQASLSGQVLDDSTGLPATIFNVALTPESSWGFVPWWSSQQARTFEDAEGRFRIEGLRPQTYRLNVKARGYKPTVLEGVRVDPGESSPVEVRLETGAALRGVVRDAETRNPVPGATVRATDFLPVETDSDGAFTIQGVEGKVRLRVTHPRYMAAEVPEAGSDRGDQVEILLARGGSVEGVVYGESGDRLPGAEISASLSGDRPTALTDAIGHYRLEGLPAGQWILSKADVPGTHQGFETQAVEVQYGRTAAQDFGVGVRLSGMVTHEGSPASGALLTLARAPGELPAGSPTMGSRAIRCREDGSYEARGLRPGNYGLMVIWEERKIGKRIVIPEKTQQNRLDIDIPEIWISGEVLDRQTRLPLRGTVLVSRKDGPDTGGYTSMMNEGDEAIAFSSNPGFAGDSDEQGRYRIALMETGTYRVQVDVRGYRLDPPIEFEVAGSRSHLELALEPAIELNVHAEESSTGRSLQAV
ncbi:MAG TPA: carboxypeptidase regulatory-like domain-containing protein, partial [Candidatus Polarisedimenticolia bacterium]|nr:carboxypeptidase regulatory-like domain-containing protein [Candidatus Polarisedimenticolia bacterium]